MKIIDEKKYLLIKKLIENGASYVETQKLLGIGTGTFRKVKGTNSYEEYKNAHYFASPLYKKTEVNQQENATSVNSGLDDKQIAPAVVTASSYQINRLIELIKEQNELMKLLSNKVAFIVESLS